MNTLNFNLNRALFEKKDYDSKFVSMLQSVHHKFTKEGHYSCNIYNNKSQLIKTFNISVEKECKTVKNNLDIHEILRNNDDHYDVSINDYIGFYVSNGSMQYTLSIFNSKNREISEFDSSNLKMSDIFCVSLFRPGKYTVEDKIITSRMVVEVFPFDKRSVSPKKIEVKDAFDLEKIELIQTETLFFIINNTKNNRIVVSYTDEKKDVQN